MCIACTGRGRFGVEQRLLEEQFGAVFGGGCGAVTTVGAACGVVERRLLRRRLLGHIARRAGDSCCNARGELRAEERGGAQKLLVVGLAEISIYNTIVLRKCRCYNKRPYVLLNLDCVVLYAFAMLFLHSPGVCLWFSTMIVYALEFCGELRCGAAIVLTTRKP